jgi:two-component system, NarL family, nitrate/nitrite response regulator NarL
MCGDRPKIKELSIAVIDDHPMFRDGVRAVLSRLSDFKVVATGTCADDAVSIAMNLQPDVVLLDVGMPGNGIEAARRITCQSLPVKIVMLTASDNPDHVTESFAAGASDYVRKGVSLDELAQRLRAVCQN